VGGLDVDYSRYQHLTIEVNDGVALVTMNRPEFYNATNNRMHWELTQIWPDIDRDPDVRIAVVTGAGDAAFSAGGDLTDLEERDELPAEQRFERIVALAKEASEIVYTIVNCDKLIISAINGVAVGAGLAVGLLADISIIAEDARLTDGHVRLGVAAGRPRLHDLAVALRHGQGEVLPAHLRLPRRSGGRAYRPGQQSRATPGGTHHRDGHRPPPGSGSAARAALHQAGVEPVAASRRHHLI